LSGHKRDIAKMIVDNTGIRIISCIKGKQLKLWGFLLK